MALILNIDTSVETASVCLAKDGDVLMLEKNDQQHDHAAWLHVAIKKIMQGTNLPLTSLNAVAVTIGPGSYTGLRVGLSAAKGFCFALQKPLIAINTLLVMANAVKETADLLCPMIDARRMEVFTAVYTNSLEIIKEPASMIIDENSFSDLLAQKSICFSGNGSPKLKSIIKNSKAVFSETIADAGNMINFSETCYEKKQFADIAYTGPLYLKEFYSPGR